MISLKKTSIVLLSLTKKKKIEISTIIFLDYFLFGNVSVIDLKLRSHSPKISLSKKKRWWLVWEKNNTFTKLRSCAMSFLSQNLSTNNIRIGSPENNVDVLPFPKNGFVLYRRDALISFCLRWKQTMKKFLKIFNFKPQSEIGHWAKRTELLVGTQWKRCGGQSWTCANTPFQRSRLMHHSNFAGDKSILAKWWNA